MDRGAWQATVHGVTRVGQDLASKLLLTTDTRDSLLAQSVKNLPAMQETQVQFLRPEDPLENKWQPTPLFLPGESHGPRSLVGYSPWGH